MKNKIILFLVAVTIAFVSCTDKDDDGKYADYSVAKPLKISKSEFNSSGDILPPQIIETSGKMYVYKKYIFINDKFKGVHVIDNRNAYRPVKIAFIQIPGNVDISVKDDVLYADSLADLLVFDIANIEDIKKINRLKNVLHNNVFWPFEADIVEWDAINYEEEILIGWETIVERREVSEVQEYFKRNGQMELMSISDNASIGQGGSLARFKIVADYLYAVDSHNINIFNIEDLNNPKDMEDVYAGFDIETIFNQGQYLFLGSRSGMYIYDISSPATPTFVSEFQHGTACDPVVVDGDYAYVTLRGGNNCGATESGLFIIDIKDITNPTLLKTYPMDGPYGLGIKEEKLFVCDGESGLKVYDKTDVENLVSLNHFEDITTFDVIPLENSLLMVGEELLYQYKYLDDGIELISTLNLQ
ncbi:MAG: hypothetical protein V3U92_08895 [Cellulophaga sp.]